MMTIEMGGETYLTTTEACEAIGVSRETLNRYVNNDMIKRYKKGLSRIAYYKQSDVQHLIHERSQLREDK